MCDKIRCCSLTESYFHFHTMNIIVVACAALLVLLLSTTTGTTSAAAASSTSTSSSLYDKLSSLTFLNEGTVHREDEFVYHSQRVGYADGPNVTTVDWAWNIVNLIDYL